MNHERTAAEMTDENCGHGEGDAAANAAAQRLAALSARLAVIGETVAAAAHESRNALQQVQACVALLRCKLAGDAEGLELLADLQRGHERLLRIFEDIHASAAPPTIRP